MPRSLGKDKSELKRSLKPGKVPRGMVGQWLVAARWKWDDDNDVFTLVHDDSEKLMFMFVYTWELDAVMEAVGGTYSHSRHLASRLLFEAVFLNKKMKLWSKGLVRPHIIDAQIAGITEEHSDRLPTLRVPWLPAQDPGGIKDQGQAPKPQIMKL